MAPATKNAGGGAPAAGGAGRAATAAAGGATGGAAKGPTPGAGGAPGGGTPATAGVPVVVTKVPKVEKQCYDANGGRMACPKSQVVSGKLAAIIVGTLVGVALLVTVLVVLHRRRQRAAQAQEDAADAHIESDAEDAAVVESELPLEKQDTPTQQPHVNPRMSAVEDLTAPLP